MSQSSHLTRYRPAIFAITGAAAACGIYILYTTFASEPAKGGLHRSNAVHRRRQPRLTVEYSEPTDSAPLGEVVVSKGDVSVSTNVNNAGAPSVARLREHFPDVPADQYSQSLLDSKAVTSVLNACYLARGNEQLQLRLRECGTASISEAMENSDTGRVLEYATTLIRHTVNTDPDTIQIATIKFLVDAGFSGFTLQDAARELQPDLAAPSNTANSDFAETEVTSYFTGPDHEPEQGLKGLLYHIAETDAKRKAYEHRGINCEECGEKPIRGVRWHCLNCPDFDLCSTCEMNTVHQKTHVFAKIKIPLPVLSQPTRPHPILYPGEQRKIYHSLPADRKAYYKQEYGFDEPQIDAYFDQFTCIANVPWKDDLAQVKAAINRQAFDKALTNERWPQRFRPNATYDRMFAFYDTDANGLIGFGEFLNGLAYLRGPKRFTPLRRALKGFDMDEDGYVDRKDFLRLLRAKYEIQKLIIGDMIEAHEEEQTYNAQETLRSSQPISSIFSWEEIPQGENRVPMGKVSDANGDLRPREGTKTILEDDEGWPKERGQRQRVTGEPHEQLQHHLSRFEELLSRPVDDESGEDIGTLPNELTQDDRIAPVEDLKDAPLDEDVLWQIVEDGFNEILDPMFLAKEKEHRRAIDARPDIQRWKQEIEDAVKQKEQLKKALQDELQAADTVDPLLATAVNSLDGSIDVQPKDQAQTDDAGPSFQSEIVPTDNESLTKREEEIANKPLDELLNSTGYSTIDDQTDANTTTNGAENADDAASSSSESEGSMESGLAREMGIELDARGRPISKPTAADPVPDPTMPQNRPNTLLTDPALENGRLKPLSPQPEDAAKPPSQERLLRLAELMVVDQEIEARGGVGRLSFEEVEAMVAADGKKELKGLVTGWLEWASF